MAETYTPPTIEELQQRLRVHSANARAKAAKAGQTDFKAKLESYKQPPPSVFEDVVGGAGQAAHQMLRGATGILDLPAAAVVGAGNIPDTFWNASHPYSPQRHIPTPQEYFGKPGEPAMQPTDLFDKYMPPIPGHENDVLNFPWEVAGGLMAGGGYRGLMSDTRAAAIADAKAGAILPTLAQAPAVAPGIVSAVSRGAADLGKALVRGGVRAATRTGVTTAGLLAGKYGGGEIGRGIAEAVGGPQYGDLGQHYGEQFGQIFVPGAIDAVKAPFYSGMNKAYVKQGDVNTPGSSAHTLQAMHDIGAPADLGTVGNSAASDIQDYPAGLPMAGGQVRRAREDLYRNLEQGVEDAAAHARTAASGSPVGPPAPGYGRNVSETSIGQQAIDAGVEAVGQPEPDFNIPSRGIHKALDTAYNDPQTGLHRNDPATGQPILSRNDPIAVQSEHQVYDTIEGRPQTAQAIAQPDVARLRGELTQSSNLVIDQALHARLLAEQANLEAQLRGVNYPPTRARIEQDLQRNAAAQAANHGPSFQAQRDLRDLGHERSGGVVLNQRISNESNAAKTATMRQAAEDRGLGDVFDTTEAEAGRLLGQRESLDKLTKDSQTEPGAFSQLFGKTGGGDLTQLGALMEHAPNPTRMAFADRFELAGRGPAQAGTRDMNPANYRPAEIVQLWDKASPEAKDAYAAQGTPLRRHVEAVVTVARADALRTAGRTKPGKGSSTLGGPQRFFTHPASLIAGGTALGSLAGFPGLGLLLGTLPTAAARLVGNRFTDPRFVQNVVHPPGVRGTLDLSRLLAAAVGGNAPSDGADQPGLLPGTNDVFLPSPRREAVNKTLQTADDLARRPLKTLRVPGF